MSNNEKELGLAMMKNLFGQVPIIGWGLNEVIFDRRSRVKQERVNRFSELLSEYMQTVNESSIDIEHLKSNEFGDIFESVIHRIMQTDNESKLKRFRDILIGNLINPSKSEFTETFLDLTTRLNESQIQILERYGRLERKVKIQFEIISDQTTLLHESDTKLIGLKHKAQNGIITPDESIAGQMKKHAKLELAKTRANDELKKLSKRKGASGFGLEEGEFQFYLQDLVSKSLLKETHSNQQGRKIHSMHKVTEFGYRYLTYILDIEFN